MKRVRPSVSSPTAVPSVARVPRADSVSVVSDERVDYPLLAAVTACLERRGYARDDVERWIAMIGEEEYWETYVAPILDLIEDSLPARR